MKQHAFSWLLAAAAMMVAAPAVAQVPAGTPLPEESILVLQEQVAALEAAVAGLSGGSPARVFSAGTAVGTVTGQRIDSSSFTSKVTMLTETGMMAVITAGPSGWSNIFPTGTLLPINDGISWDTSLYFITDDCTGPAFVSDPGYSPTPGQPGNGLELQANTGAVGRQAGRVVYMPPGTAPVSGTPGSVLYFDEWLGGEFCSLAGSWSMDGYPVLPNDPAVTGVPDSGVFPAPVRLGY